MKNTKNNLICFAIVFIVLIGLTVSGLNYYALNNRTQELESQLKDLKVQKQKTVQSSKDDVLAFQTVSSDRYSILIPILDGFTLNSQEQNSEFLLSNKDKDITFYFESDYSPGPSCLDYEAWGVEWEGECLAHRYEYKITSTQEEQYNIRGVRDDGINSQKSSYLLYGEADSDKSFYFSVVYNSDLGELFTEERAIVDKIIRNLHFTHQCYKTYTEGEVNFSYPCGWNTDVTGKDTMSAVGTVVAPDGKASFHYPAPEVGLHGMKMSQESRVRINHSDYLAKTYEGNNQTLVFIEMGTALSQYGYNLMLAYESTEYEDEFDYILKTFKF